MIRQISPIVSVEAAEITVVFPEPTLRNALLVAAFRLPRAALERVVDSAGTAWRLANTTQFGGSKSSAWYRRAGHQVLRENPLFPDVTQLVTVPGVAGVTAVTATVCNRQVLAVSGMVLEFRKHTPFAEAIDVLHDLAMDLEAA